ncbi:hypothetical protein D3C80_997020 [compost metagenome]
MHRGIDRVAQRGRDDDRHLLAGRLPTGVETGVTGGGNFRQIHGNTAHFRAGGEALEQPAQQHQNRCRHANGGIAWHQGDQYGTGSHDRQRHDQPLATAHLVDVRPQHNGAQRTHQESGAEYREGHHQRGKLAGGWKEGLGDVGRVEPEQKEVELLEKVTAGDPQNGAQFGPLGSGCCRCRFHHGYRYAHYCFWNECFNRQSLPALIGLG